MNRRGFLGGLLAMPVIIRTPGLLMAVHSLMRHDVDLMVEGRRVPIAYSGDIFLDMMRAMLRVPGNNVYERSHFVASYDARKEMDAQAQRYANLPMDRFPDGAPIIEKFRNIPILTRYRTA